MPTAPFLVCIGDGFPRFLPVLDIFLLGWQQALSEQRIFMNAVDTGWINDENPLDKVRGLAHLIGMAFPLFAALDSQQQLK